MFDFNLQYDINNFYQVVVNLLNSLWPIIAAGLGILMAGMVLGMIADVFRRWIEDRRG